MEDTFIIMMLISLLMLLLGVIFLGISFGMRHSEKKKYKVCISHTTGTVIDIERHTSSAVSDGVPTTAWYPVFEYSVGGHSIKKRSNYGEARDSYYIGQKVNVYYNPDNYAQFHVAEQNISQIIKIFFGVGMVLVIASLAILGCALYFRSQVS